MVRRITPALRWLTRPQTHRQRWRRRAQLSILVVVLGLAVSFANTPITQVAIDLHYKLNPPSGTSPFRYGNCSMAAHEWTWVAPEFGGPDGDCALAH